MTNKDIDLQIKHKAKYTCTHATDRHTHTHTHTHTHSSCMYLKVPKSLHYNTTYVAMATDATCVSLAQVDLVW